MTTRHHESTESKKVTMNSQRWRCKAWLHVRVCSIPAPTGHGRGRSREHVFYGEQAVPGTKPDGQSQRHCQQQRLHHPLCARTHANCGLASEQEEREYGRRHPPQKMEVIGHARIRKTG
jgi:hypothetical protein